MGSDVRPPFIFFSSTRFNSRSRMGSDGIATFNRRIVVRFQFALPHGERRIRVLGYSVMRTFQFALPHGERRIGVVAPLLNAWFQFALPHGERPKSSYFRCAFYRFNSRSRMGSDHRQNPQTHLPQGFNSRSRMGSDSSPTRYRCLAARFQFALPHGERHARPPKLWLRTEVSIRAPAWGATTGVNEIAARLPVSIRAPAWGATATSQR